ncbi:MAG: NCS2 family permease [Lachnospiraceae bacterium]|uniref:NCS2 family permease n=1 Tax=Candidatus Weimeria bifida TaxID=2599074 RepID=A0A6N7IZA4_9FIRM|nr:NCS2 family permease [Candidatus Weimeria bifida]RRF95971.1 MAG: NCS2 family permease [Lachnospiraceae bacterium]
MLEKAFHLKENGTNVKTEIMAGITTFMTMAYILAVNPNILSSTGMDSTAVLIATCLASCFGTLCMCFMANYPFALAPGMGLNAFFAYTVCKNMGYSWQVALAAVFIEGIVFIVLSLTNVREAIFNAIPSTLKQGVSAGIGLFVAFIGLQDGKLIADSPSTFVTYVDFRKNWHQAGSFALLALIGLMVISILYIRGITGAVLYGIIITWIIGMIFQAVGIYVPNPEKGFYSVFPTAVFTDFSKFGNTFGQCFKGFATMNDKGVFNFITVCFSFLFVDIFDTIGTLVGCSEKAGFLDKNGKLPHIKGALLADACATSVGAVFGTSTTTTFVESAAGVGAGGRTGLTSLTTGLLFIVAMFFSPIFTAIPGFATSPALIFVGFLMLSAVLKIDFNDFREAIPAYLAIIAMPMFYSISEGISIGIISYVIINTICNTFMKEKKRVTILMYVLAVLFILKYILIPR